METEVDIDLEATRDAVADPDMHAIQHVNSWDELNALSNDMTALQAQVDMLYDMMLQLAGVLNNQVLPVPIAFDAIEKE